MSNQNKRKYNNSYQSNQSNQQSYSNTNQNNQSSNKQQNKSKNQNQTNNNNISNNEDNTTQIYLFPGESYQFNDQLIHYDAFGYKNGNLVSKRFGYLICDKTTGKPQEDPNKEIYRSIGNYYSPQVDDFVIGTIVHKASEQYKLDIGTYTYAILNTQNFEGATKKTKPNYNLGDIVFARVLKTNKYDAPSLSCISETQSKNWASGESFFGILKGGMLFSFPKKYAWDLLNDNYSLKRLQDVVNFECVTGFNGKMWIDSEKQENIFDIYDIIIKSLTITQDETEKLIHETFINKMQTD